MSEEPTQELAEVLPTAAAEIEEHIAAEGWDQVTQVFALVRTQELITAEPQLADQVDPDSLLTPIAQEQLPAEDLAEALSQLVWPEQVTGCALAQEIVVLPPEAEAELPSEDERAREIAANHPERRDARLVAAVLREGGEACVVRLRDSEDDQGGEVFQDPTLAPNLIEALKQTFTG